MDGFAIKPNRSKITEDLNQSLMLVTALTPVIGYEKANEIARLAYLQNISLRQAAFKLGHISESDFDRFMRFAKRYASTHGMGYTERK